MTWTLFWDMHSGGGTKLPPWDKIYVEAPEDDARRFFKLRFDRNPENVTCSCCGEDYSVSQDESLAQATGYHRNLRCVETPRDPETGRYKNEDPHAGRYLEEGEDPPAGYKVGARYGTPLTLDEYCALPSVLIVRGDEVLRVLRSTQAPPQDSKNAERKDGA